MTEHVPPTPENSATDAARRPVGWRWWRLSGVAVLSAWLVALAGQPIGRLVEGTGGRALRAALRGRVADLPTFVGQILQEVALLLTAAVVLAALVGALSSFFHRHFRNPLAALGSSVATGFVAANLFAWVASETVVFWLALMAAGPNLKQPAFHIERLLLQRSSAPVRTVVVGSSQGHSEIRVSYLDDACGPKYKFANMSFAGSGGFDFLLLREQFRGLHPNYVIVYISPQAFFTGLGGGRMLPFLSFGSLDDLRRLGVVERLKGDDLWYGTLGMTSPLFRVRRAATDAAFGETDDDEDEAVDTGETSGVAQLAATYEANEASQIQMRAFIEFLDQLTHDGSQPIVLVGQVHPSLDAAFDPTVKAAFDRFVASLRARPAVRVLREGLPWHDASDYAPGDYMHVTDAARMRYTKALVTVLQREIGLCTR